MISNIESPFRAFGGSSASRSEEQLAIAARAVNNSTAGLSKAEFASDVDPSEAGRLFEWSDVQNDNRAWLRRVVDRRIGASADELTTTTRAVFEVLARHGAGAINLAGLSPQVNGMHLAMVLRATADELDGTEAWKKALVVARAALEEAGVNPSVALYGLTQAE